MDGSVAVYLDGTAEFEIALHYAVRLISCRTGKIVLVTTSKAFNDSTAEAQAYLHRVVMGLRHEDIVTSVCTAFSNDDEVNSIQAAVDLYKIRTTVLSDKLAVNLVAH